MMKTTWNERAEWADIIRPLRMNKAWSQVDLARAADVSLSSIQKIELGTEGSRALFEKLRTILTEPKKRRAARLPS